VLIHIDEDCFKVVEKETGHTFVNYKKMGNETFPPFATPASSDPWDVARAASENHRAAIRRECRGIAFDTATGEIVSRPFHKFFNVGEREDMDIPTLDFGLPHVVQDKIDGSMVRPLMTPHGIRWGTKMGVTDVAMVAELFVEDNPIYEDFAACYIEKGMTPIFEFTSPENRIVVDYGRAANMTLLAIRDNVTGQYLEYDNTLLLIADRWEIPLVNMFDPVEGDPSVYFSAVKSDDELDEGIVIQWQNGHRAKVKTDVYTTLHRVKESARTERTLVKAILAGEVDDLLPLVPAEDRADIERFARNFWHSVRTIAEDIDVMFHEVRLDFDTKKAFATCSGGMKDMTRLESSIVFSLWDGKLVDGDDAVNQIITQGLVSETKWQEMRQNVAATSNLSNFAMNWQSKEDFE